VKWGWRRLTANDLRRVSSQEAPIFVHVIHVICFAFWMLIPEYAVVAAPLTLDFHLLQFSAQGTVRLEPARLLILCIYHSILILSFIAIKVRAMTNKKKTQAKKKQAQAAQQAQRPQPNGVEYDHNLVTCSHITNLHPQQKFRSSAFTKFLPSRSKPPSIPFQSPSNQWHFYPRAGGPFCRGGQGTWKCSF
jgi:hypothetical protein